MWWTESLGRINLQLTRAQAASASHPGPCDADVAALVRTPAIARQLRKIPPALIAESLREVGAWDATELSDHAQNLQRLVWIAANDITEELFMKQRA
jgi:hypothetical protein